MKYRKKSIIIEATRWFRNGDHPKDDCKLLLDSDHHPFTSEGKVVRYYRHPSVSGESACISSIPCSSAMHFHGWIDTPEGGHTVCPGDWIITGIKGEHYPIKDEIFRLTYEAALLAEREKALREAAGVARNFRDKRMVDRGVHEMTASGLAAGIYKEILSLIQKEKEK